MNRSPQLDDADYERFRDLILARTGMLFGPRQRDALARGLTSAAGRTGVQDLASYYHALQAARTDTPLWDDLVGAITVGETYFFRSPAHFDALRERILPDLIARHQARSPPAHLERRLLHRRGALLSGHPAARAAARPGPVEHLRSWPPTSTGTPCDRPARVASASGPFARRNRPSASDTSGRRMARLNSMPRCEAWSRLPT